MNNRYFFAQQNLPDNSHGHQKNGKRALVVERRHWQIVDFEAVGHEPHADPLVVVVRHDDHFVAELEQTLGQLEDVALHTAHIRVEEVRDHASKTKISNPSPSDVHHTVQILIFWLYQTATAP